MANDLAIFISSRNRYVSTYEAARAYIAESQSSATKRAYASDWRIFEEFCRKHNLPALPTSPTTVALFLAEQAESGLKVKTIERRIAAISDVHSKAGETPPTKMKDSEAITAVMQGIRRVHGTKVEKKKPATDDIVLQLLDSIKGSELADIRDKALLAFGMASALRRHELGHLRIEDLSFSDEGVTVYIPHSKTDQEGEGQVIVVPNGKYIRPVHRLKEWIKAAGITEGYVFRPLVKGGKRTRELPLSGNAIATIVKNRSCDAGLDPKEFSGHSLRSGFVTSAARNKADLFKISDQSRHKSIDMLRQYVIDQNRYENHAGDSFL